MLLIKKLKDLFIKFIIFIKKTKKMNISKKKLYREMKKKVNYVKKLIKQFYRTIILNIRIVFSTLYYLLIHIFCLVFNNIIFLYFYLAEKIKIIKSYVYKKLETIEYYFYEILEILKYYFCETIETIFDYTAILVIPVLNFIYNILKFITNLIYVIISWIINALIITLKITHMLYIKPVIFFIYKITLLPIINFIYPKIRNTKYWFLVLSYYNLLITYIYHNKEKIINFFNFFIVFINYFFNENIIKKFYIFLEKIEKIGNITFKKFVEFLLLIYTFLIVNVFFYLSLYEMLFAYESYFIKYHIFYFNMFLSYLLSILIYFLMFFFKKTVKTIFYSTISIIAIVFIYQFYDIALLWIYYRNRDYYDFWYEFIKFWIIEIFFWPC